MEPITIMLLAAWITKVVTTHREDMEYARHGQESPRYKLKMAQFKAAQQAGQQGGRPPVRPGASGYMQELWRDSWEDLTEWRRRRRQDKKDAAEQERAEQAESLREWSRRSLNTRPDGRPVDDMIDVAGVRPDQVPHPHDPNNTRNCPDCKGTVVVDGKPCPSCLLRQQQRNAEYEQQHGEGAGEPAPPQPDRQRAQSQDALDRVAGGVAAARSLRREPGVTSCDRCGRETHIDNLTPMSNGSEVELWCDRHDRPQRPEQPASGSDDLTADDVLPSLLDGPAGAGHPNCDRCLEFYRVENGRMVCGCTAHTPRPEAEDSPALDNTQPLATVIPLFPNTKEMTMANAEATGLPTAIAYAEAAASAHETFATAGSEGYINALEGFEVGGEALASGREAQEASTIAGEKWRAHHEKLVAQMQGREFYQSNPDAGNKQFLAGE